MVQTLENCFDYLVVNSLIFDLEYTWGWNHEIRIRFVKILILLI